MDGAPGTESGPPITEPESPLSTMCCRVVYPSLLYSNKHDKHLSYLVGCALTNTDIRAVNIVREPYFEPVELLPIFSAQSCIRVQFSSDVSFRGGGRARLCSARCAVVVFTDFPPQTLLTHINPFSNKIL